MSPPAPAPTGLTVATVRAGLARGLGVAVPAVRLWLGQAAPGEYRSPFPARLRIARAAIVVLSLLWLVAGFHELSATRSIVQTIGHDTVPSVTAAGTIQTGLSRVDEDLAALLLSGEGMNDFFEKTLRGHLLAVRAALLEAAYNVTYGDEEREPIRVVLQSLGDYEETIGRSIASQPPARRDLAFIAADLMSATILPASAKLGKANADHLEAAYLAYRGSAGLGWLLAATTALTMALVAAQLDMARTARRLVNPGLAVATTVLVVVTIAVVLRVDAARSELHVAKENAFDSIYALSNARATAADADAAQSYWVLAVDDHARADRYRTSFRYLAGSLVEVDASSVDHIVDRGERLPGYLGDELANVTFEGEKDAARGAVRAWGAVMDVDRTLTHTVLAGDTASVIHSKLYDVPGSARLAFADFDRAIIKLQAINQSAFAASIASAERDDAPLGAVLVAAFVLTVAAAWFGIGRRLDDYRF